MLWLHQLASGPWASNLAFFALRFCSLLDKGFSGASAATSEPTEAFLFRPSWPLVSVDGTLPLSTAFGFCVEFSGLVVSPPWTMSTMPRQLVRFSFAKAVTLRASSHIASFPRSCDRPQTQVKFITSHGARRLKARRASLDTIMPRPRVARTNAIAFPMRFRRASSPLPVTPGP